MDLYVNDAFGSAHRAHSSTEAVAHLLPAYAGLLLLAELEHLGRLLGEVGHPFVIVAGGAKVDDKLAVLENLGGRADRVLIGGKMAEQLRDHNPLSFPVELPVDVVAASSFAEDAEARVAAVDAVPPAGSVSTSGRRRPTAFGAIVARGTHDLLERPDGRVRMEPFAAGTRAVAEAVAAADAYSVVGGGDSVRAIQELGLADRVSWVSTGGGASLELLEGRGASRRRGDPGGMTMTKLMAGNWKMFKGPVETLAFFDEFEAPDGVDVVLCPPFVSLEAAVGEEWPIYAQNVHWADEGAFTGEISARMLVELGVAGTLVGHSERRLYFGETDETVRLRAEAALAAGLGGDRVRRRDGGRAGGRRDRGRAAPAGRRAAAARAPRDRLRAGLGDRHRQDRDARDGAGGARADQVAPRHPRALRRLGQARECRASCSPSPTSTALSSAAPRSTPRPSRACAEIAASLS